MPPFELPRPIERLCKRCGGYKTLWLCPGCSKVGYCSTECRHSDWPTHRSECKRAHLNLATFYPAVAWAAELTRLQRLDHPALHHQIIDAPARAYTESERLPDGSVSCVIRYGLEMDFVPQSLPPPRRPRWVGPRSKRPKSPPPDPPSLRRWWPSCPSLTERAYLRRRISRDGHLLPLLIGMGAALLLELYSVSSPSSSPPCLHFEGIPIYDFGIYYGSVRIDHDRTLAYAKNDKSGGTPTRRQDPQNHFWLYFQTEDQKEELFLDIGLFVYGYRDQVLNADYYLPWRDRVNAKRKIINFLDIPARHHAFVDPYVAAHFSDKSIQDAMYRSGVLLHKKKRRFSIMRDETLLFGLERMTRSSGMGRWRITKEAIGALTTFMIVADSEARTVEDIDLGMKFLLDTMMNGTRIIANLRDEIEAGWKELPRPHIENCKWELGINSEVPTK